MKLSNLLFLLFLILVCGLCGCNMQTTAYRAIDMGRVEDDTGEQLSDFGGNVAYAASTDEPGTLNPQTLLSECTTSFAGGKAARKENITLASNAINGTIIKPGEVFSFNETVGPTNKKAGFRLARIFVGGRDSEGYGGGVCQVSSTLYKAAKEAGLEIVERHPHSKRVTYLPKGEDAATSYGRIDLKIRNNKNCNVKIETCADNELVTVVLLTA